MRTVLALAALTLGLACAPARELVSVEVAISSNTKADLGKAEIFQRLYDAGFDLLVEYTERVCSKGPCFWRMHAWVDVELVPDLRAYRDRILRVEYVREASEAPMLVEPASQSH